MTKKNKIKYDRETMQRVATDMNIVLGLDPFIQTTDDKDHVDEEGKKDWLDNMSMRALIIHEGSDVFWDDNLQDETWEVLAGMETAKGALTERNKKQQYQPEDGIVEQLQADKDAKDAAAKKEAEKKTAAKKTAPKDEPDPGAPPPNPEAAFKRATAGKPSEDPTPPVEPPEPVVNTDKDPPHVDPSARFSKRGRTYRRIDSIAEAIRDYSPATPEKLALIADKLYSKKGSRPTTKKGAEWPLDNVFPLLESLGLLEYHPGDKITVKGVNIGDDQEG